MVLMSYYVPFIAVFIFLLSIYTTDINIISLSLLSPHFIRSDWSLEQSSMLTDPKYLISTYTSDSSHHIIRINHIENSWTNHANQSTACDNWLVHIIYACNRQRARSRTPGELKTMYADMWSSYQSPLRIFAYICFYVKKPAAYRGH